MDAPLTKSVDPGSVGLLDTDYLSQLIAIEGSAERVRSRYATTFTPLETLQSLQEQLNAGSDPALLTIPITLLTLTSAPYLRGAVFQNQLVAALGNPAGPDESFDALPGEHRAGFRHRQVSGERTSRRHTCATDRFRRTRSALR